MKFDALMDLDTARLICVLSQDGNVSSSREVAVDRSCAGGLGHDTMADLLYENRATMSSNQRSERTN